MKLIRQVAYARAGLFGNPSDGYQGRTIGIIVRNFHAQVSLYEWEDVEIVLSQEERSVFSSIHELVSDVDQHGYYGGIRLVKATIKRFAEYCQAQGHQLHDQNFAVRYESNIPRNVGLAGSSAIIVATLRCLMEFYDVKIPLRVQPSLALSVENDELGIAAGLQDRVMQVYEGTVYMDFSAKKSETLHDLPCGYYQPLPSENLPPLYVAFSLSREVAQPTEIPSADIRTRFRQGDPQVLAAMQRLAELTDEARAALLASDHATLAKLANENFDIRLSIYPHMLQQQRQMVEQARSTGASAKFAGSGGAIVGTYQDEAMFQRLQQAMAQINCRVMKPEVGPSRTE